MIKSLKLLTLITVLFGLTSCSSFFGNQKEFNNTDTATIETLETPAIVSDINNDHSFSWIKIDNADSYSIYVNNQVISTIETNHYTLQESDFAESYIYNCYIKANGDNLHYKDSDFSNTISIMKNITTKNMTIDTNSYLLKMEEMSTTSKEFELKEFVFNCDSSTITYFFSFVNRIEADLKIYFYTDKITKTVNTYDNLERGFNIYDKKGEIQYSNFEKITSVVFTIASYSKTINYTSDSTSLKEIQEKSRKTVLDSPIVKRYGNLLEWDSITNADYYEILINDVYVENNYTSNSYRVDTSKYSSLENITVKIRAGNADHDNYFESNFTTIKMPSSTINITYRTILYAELTSDVNISLSCEDTAKSYVRFYIKYSGKISGNVVLFGSNDLYKQFSSAPEGKNTISITMDSKLIMNLNALSICFFYGEGSSQIQDFYHFDFATITNYLFSV